MSLYGIIARLDAFKHYLKGHKIIWRTEADDICKGDIVCDTCNLCIWCRFYDLSDKQKEKVLSKVKNV